MRRTCAIWGTALSLACSGPTERTAPGGSDSGLDSGTDLLLLQDAAYYAAAPGDPVTVQLVSAELWTLVSAEDDPYDHRPDDITCSSLGYFEEDDTFEVDTEACTYGTFRQPLLHDLREGDEALTIYWFDELWAPEAAEGHMALSIGGEVVFDDWVAIPGDPETRRATWTAPRDFVAGEWVTFHVHNHGFNNWVLGLVQADTVK